MGLVTNVYWKCPNCGSVERAQLYGDWGWPESFPPGDVPADSDLKWNPPCEVCGKYQLTKEDGHTVCVAQKIDTGESNAKQV